MVAVKDKVPMCFVFIDSCCVFLDSYRSRVVRAAWLLVQKVAVRWQVRGLENSLCPLSSKRYLFRIKEGLGSERRGMDSAFHLLCPRYSGTLTPSAPTAIRL